MNGWNNENENLSFLDFMTIFSVGLQVMGYQQNLRQTSTDDLMKALQRQDREYLDKIIENQNEIMELLKTLSPNG